MREKITILSLLAVILLTLLPGSTFAADNDRFQYRPVYCGNNWERVGSQYMPWKFRNRSDSDRVVGITVQKTDFSTGETRIQSFALTLSPGQTIQSVFTGTPDWVYQFVIFDVPTGVDHTFKDYCVFEGDFRFGDFVGKVRAIDDGGPFSGVYKLPVLGNYWYSDEFIINRGTFVDTSEEHLEAYKCVTATFLNRRSARDGFRYIALHVKVHPDEDAHNYCPNPR